MESLTLITNDTRTPHPDQVVRGESITTGAVVVGTVRSIEFVRDASAPDDLGVVWNGHLLVRVERVERMPEFARNWPKPGQTVRVQRWEAA